MKFTVPGEPQGKARARTVSAHGKVHSYTPEKTVLYESLIRDAFLRSAGEFILSEGDPFAVCVKAYFKIPSSASMAKKQDMLSGKTLPTRKPDADNILKAVCDALNKTLWRDDSQVVHCVVEKRYALEPRLEIYICKEESACCTSPAHYRS